jgi:hypothetical protein
MEAAQKPKPVTMPEAQVVAHEAVELRAVGQSGEGTAQAAPRVTVEIPFAAEAGPPGEDGKGNDLALGEGCIGSGMSFISRAGLAEVVHHNVECGEEGVHIEHEESVPFPSGSVSKPTLANGHLPLKSSMDDSHQAFKVCHHAHPMHRYTRVARQAVQEAPVGSGKAFARRTRCEQEFADGLAPVREG